VLFGWLCISLYFTFDVFIPRAIPFVLSLLALTLNDISLYVSPCNGDSAQPMYAESFQVLFHQWWTCSIPIYAFFKTTVIDLALFSNCRYTLTLESQLPSLLIPCDLFISISSKLSSARSPPFLSL